MSSSRIVFMGTPDFAVTILDKLIQENHNIVGVVTAPDKPAGRGRKINQSAVKKYAIEKQLNTLQPTNLKSEDFISELKGLNADLFIVVAFRMLPKVIWQLPKQGTFNLHASLLPDYRGAAPINWAIINGETKTGVSTFFIDEKIDTGEIILQKEINIDESETVGQLHDKLMHLGADLVNETVQRIESGTIQTTKQPEKEEKIAPKLNTTNCKINWNQPVKDIYNHIRGLNPYPSAWSTLNNINQELKTKIYDVTKSDIKSSLPPGRLITTKKELRVCTADYDLIINSLKVEGKKLMSPQNLFNGFKIEEGANFL